MQKHLSALPQPHPQADSCSVLCQGSRSSIGVVFLMVVFLLPGWQSICALEDADSEAAATPVTGADSQLPEAPPAPQHDQSKSCGSSLGTALKTIGEDELHIIKSPFSLSSSTMRWNALVVGATGILIANDESVLHQVPTSWHDTSINISNATLYGLGATAGGIFVTGLATHNEHAIDTGIRSAEASVDSVLLYAAMKAVLARQRLENAILQRVAIQ